MADISNVNAGVIKDLYERLESLGCMIIFPLPPDARADSNAFCSPNYDSDPVLDELAMLFRL